MTDMVMISLVVAEARGRCKADASLEENVATVMDSAAHHWMVLDDDPQFKGAVASLLYHYKDKPEEERIRRELADIGKISAILVAAQAGLSVNLPDADEEEPYEKIGLMEAFWKAKGR